MTKPKILVLDIETAPGSAYIWSLYDDGPIPLERLIRPGRILCWTAKYVGESHVFQADERGGREAMLAELARLLATADAVVTYNGNRFDLRKIRGELLAARLRPFPKLTSIDLYQTIKEMGLFSSKLEYVSQYTEIGKKLRHEGFGLWRKIVEYNDSKAWTKMLRYNKRDVLLTERLYKRLAPYIATHPRLRPAKDRPDCDVCGSSRLQSRGHRYTRLFKIERFQCTACGHWPEGKRTRIK
jgi:hypothetical protein